MDSIMKNYENMWKAFIRPYRQTYSLADLGHNQITILSQNKRAKRRDIEITNKRGYKLACSYIELMDQPQPYPIIIYLHCNSGSKLEGILYMEDIVSRNMGLCIFDFSGSGLSEGQYISLGFYESDDLDCVIKYLKQTNKFSQICLWGRSMGAVTAIIHGSKDSSICCSVYDSPFSSLMKLAREIAQDKTGLPQFIITGALQFIKQTIQSKAKFNISDLDIVKKAEKCQVPALFITSKSDTFTKHHHSEKLQSVYKGAHKTQYFEGEHNESRPEFLTKIILDFIEAQIKESSKKEKDFNFCHKKNIFEITQQNHDKFNQQQPSSLSQQQQNQHQNLQNTQQVQQQNNEKQQIYQVQSESNNLVQQANSIKNGTLTPQSKVQFENQKETHYKKNNSEIKNNQETILNGGSQETFSTQNLQFHTQDSRQNNNYEINSMMISIDNQKKIIQNEISTPQSKQNKKIFDLSNLSKKSNGNNNQYHPAHNSHNYNKSNNNSNDLHHLRNCNSLTSGVQSEDKRQQNPIVSPGFIETRLFSVNKSHQKNTQENQVFSYQKQNTHQQEEILVEIDNQNITPEKINQKQFKKNKETSINQNIQSQQFTRYPVLEIKPDHNYQQQIQNCHVQQYQQLKTQDNVLLSSENISQIYSRKNSEMLNNNEQQGNIRFQPYLNQQFNCAKPILLHQKFEIELNNINNNENNNNNQTANLNYEKAKFLNNQQPNKDHYFNLNFQMGGLNEEKQQNKINPQQSSITEPDSNIINETKVHQQPLNNQNEYLLNCPLQFSSNNSNFKRKLDNINQEVSYKDYSQHTTPRIYDPSADMARNNTSNNSQSQTQTKKPLFPSNQKFDFKNCKAAYSAPIKQIKVQRNSRESSQSNNFIRSNSNNDFILHNTNTSNNPNSNTNNSNTINNNNNTNNNNTINNNNINNTSNINLIKNTFSNNIENQPNKIQIEKICSSEINLFQNNKNTLNKNNQEKILAFKNSNNVTQNIAQEDLQTLVSESKNSLKEAEALKKSTENLVQKFMNPYNNINNNINKQNQKQHSNNKNCHNINPQYFQNHFVSKKDLDNKVKGIIAYQQNQNSSKQQMHQQQDPQKTIESDKDQKSNLFSHQNPKDQTSNGKQKNNNQQNQNNNQKPRSTTAPGYQGDQLFNQINQENTIQLKQTQNSPQKQKSSEKKENANFINQKNIQNDKISLINDKNQQIQIQNSNNNSNSNEKQNNLQFKENIPKEFNNQQQNQNKTKNYEIQGLLRDFQVK